MSQPEQELNTLAELNAYVQLELVRSYETTERLRWIRERLDELETRAAALLAEQDHRKNLGPA